MKKTLLLLTLVGGLVLPAITHADTPVTKGKKAAKAAVVRTAQPTNHVVYYMMSEPRTGSLIPMVYRKYNGRIDAASNAAVYGQTDIEHTGALDVGTSLSRLDSSFTTGHRGI